MATVCVITPEQNTIVNSPNAIYANFVNSPNRSPQHTAQTTMMTPNYSYLTPTSAMLVTTPSSTLTPSSGSGSFPNSPHAHAQQATFHPATSSYNGFNANNGWNSNNGVQDDSDMGCNSWETENGWKRYPTAPTTGGANMKWEKKADGSTTTNYTVSKYSKFVNNVNCDTATPQNIDRDDVKPDGSVFYIRVVEINYWPKEAREAILQEDTLALIRGMCGSVNVSVKGQLTEGAGQPPRGCFPLFIECSGLDWIQCEQAVKHVEEVGDYIMSQQN